MKTKLTFILIFILFMLITGKSFALSWQDPEWETKGCSKNPFGLWKLRTDGNKNPETLIVNKESFTLIKNSEPYKEIFFKTNQIKNKAFYFELKIKDLPLGNYQSPFLKIRPHRVQTNSGNSSSGKIQVQCFIKVFQYQTKKDTYNDKYKSWNIYEIENQN